MTVNMKSRYGPVPQPVQIENGAMAVQILSTCPPKSNGPRSSSDAATCPIRPHVIFPDVRPRQQPGLPHTARISLAPGHSNLAAAEDGRRPNAETRFWGNTPLRSVFAEAALPHHSATSRW